MDYNKAALEMHKDNKGNSIKLRGRLFFDIAALQETKTGGAALSIDDSEFRAARIGVEGNYGDFKYVGELDFAGGKTSFKDVNITWKGPVNIKAGQMKAPVSMEELNSGRHITFMERGMVTDAFGLDRRIGITVGKSGKNYSAAAGVFGNSINGAQDGKKTNTVFAARGTYAPVLKDGQVLHIGASVRHVDRTAGAPKRSARWGAHLATEKINPAIGDDAFLFGLEAAGVFGPAHIHGEYMKESGDLGSAKGGFIQGGYFLTGETRTYKAGSGKFDRTKPSRPLSKGGYGGLEIAARYDRLDARNAFDEKGETFTAGLTWYPESHLRLKAEYIDASADLYKASGVQMRLQVDW